MRLVIPALAVSVLVTMGCRGGGHSAAPDGREFPHVTAAIDRHAPTMDDLSALTYNRTRVGTVRLVNGISQAESGATVELIRGFRLTGDITQNGTDEAVAVLRIGTGSEQHQDLVVVGWAGGDLLNLATVSLPDRFMVIEGRIEPRRIVLEGNEQGKGGRLSLTFALDGSALRLVSR